jgi:hypothetical protein
MLLFTINKKIDYTSVISFFEKDNTDDIQSLLWQPVNLKINYLPASCEMIKKLCRPTNDSRQLKIHQVHHSGEFELLILDVPWSSSDISYTPLLFSKKSKKIIWIMLPFNELQNTFSYKQQKQINKLTETLLNFVIPLRFK